MTEQERLDIKYWAQAKAGRDCAIIGTLFLVVLVLAYIGMLVLAYGEMPK